MDTSYRQWKLLVRYSEFQPDALGWMSSLRSGLLNLAIKALADKQASSASFVKILVEGGEGGQVSEICQEKVSGLPDTDEDPKVVCSSNLEYMTICRTFVSEIDKNGNFKFGEVDVNLRVLCAACIFLASVRYTTALLLATSRFESACGASMVAGQSGDTRSQATNSMLEVLGKWFKVGRQYIF